MICGPLRRVTWLSSCAHKRSGRLMAGTFFFPRPANASTIYFTCLSRRAGSLRLRVMAHNLYPLVICYSLRTWKWPIESSWIYPTRKWWIFPSFFVGLPGRVYDTYMILILIRVDHRSQLENGGSFQLANCKRLPVGLIIGSLKPRKFTAETVAPSGYGAICIIKKTSVYI